MVCPHGQRGEGAETVRTFCGQGGGVNFFAILCGRPLWTASYAFHAVKHGNNGFAV